MTGEGRLVRDCMIEKINRVTPYTRPVDEEELLDLLQDKLLEEVGEVLRAMRHFARRPHELLGELGDVLDVIHAIAKAYDYDFADVEKAASIKTHNRGGFNTVLCWAQPEDMVEDRGCTLMGPYIDPNDIRIDTYRSAGTGGQVVYDPEPRAMVKITHKPTGIIVVASEHDSQIKNKAKALEMLREELRKL